MQIYNETQLQEKILGELKEIACSLNVKPPGDARIKANWILENAFTYIMLGFSPWAIFLAI
jgi:hypothetical protein